MISFFGGVCGGSGGGGGGERKKGGMWKKTWPSLKFNLSPEREREITSILDIVHPLWSNDSRWVERERGGRGREGGGYLLLQYDNMGKSEGGGRLLAKN